MTNLSDWPEGFERGLPDAEGVYACIVNLAPHDRHDRATFAIELVDIQEFEKLAADELGIEPGLCACDAEGCVYNSTTTASWGTTGSATTRTTSRPLMGLKA